MNTASASPLAASTHDGDAGLKGPPQGVYVAFSVGIEMTGNVERFLDRPVVHRPSRMPADAVAVLGWGLKGRKSLDAMRMAEQHKLPYLALEDGFLRSVELGNRAPPLSLLVDDLGIYYDARRPSRLESLIAAGHTPAQQQRAAALRGRWCEGRLSKYNHARELPPPVQGDFVLVVDQTWGDASIGHGLASADSFRLMLEAALDEHPSLPVVLKVHPDVIAGRKRAHFDALTPAQSSRVLLLAADAHAPSLLAAASAVYVVTSQMGFEALLWGKPVRCFGMPFYAGWGLTGDAVAAPPRRRLERVLQIDELVHAALVDYPRYLDPETLQRCEAERLVEWMSLQRRMRERFAPRLQAIGFSNWKKPIARAFMAGSGLDFVAKGDAPAPGRDSVAWGRQPQALAARCGGSLLRVEDGFLRSVGLGADWVKPLSWVIDRRGMYYDATQPSDLEHLLQTTAFDSTLLARAAALRQSIVAGGVTKYNVGTGHWRRPADAQRVVLVPGQVEDDASIAWGAPGLRRNIELLQAARQRCPGAWIVYKPHPDVLARKRGDSSSLEQARRHCDEIVTDVPIGALFAQVDELQVLTSLAGFEALLRGKTVVCHGSPFYAGWGLTEDMHEHPRRQRRLTVDELVAATLILYPTYVSRVSNAFTTPERALHELQHWAEIGPPAVPLRLRALRTLKRWRDRLRRP